MAMHMLPKFRRRLARKCRNLEFLRISDQSHNSPFLLRCFVVQNAVKLEEKKNKQNSILMEII